jgi:hypothetical protein
MEDKMKDWTLGMLAEPVITPWSSEHSCGANGAELQRHGCTDSRREFENWCMNEMHCSRNELERLTAGRGSYRLHNVQCWWMGWNGRQGSIPSVADSKPAAPEEVKLGAQEEANAVDIPEEA